MTTPTKRAVLEALGEPPRGFSSLPAGFVLAFDVRGKAQTQGDLVRSPHGGLYHRDRNELLNWRLRIANAAETAMGSLLPTPRPVVVELEFRVYRPASHFLPVNSKRPTPELRQDAPSHPITRAQGDIDKLVRAALDALTSVVYADDSQVVDIRVTKRFAGLDETRGVSGTVREIVA